MYLLLISSRKYLAVETELSSKEIGKEWWCPISLLI